MCGICGVVASHPEHTVEAAVLQRMCATLIHRGPDDEGYFLRQSVGLGARRLSIIDLATGNQPMLNERDTVALVFNGEIYNYREVRARLERAGHLFASRSDSEVVVHAYEEYGARCVEHLNGMFAFAIWDAPRRRLFLARDRLGIKPLYYWAGRDQIVFGSELKAVIAHPAVPREIDLAGLDRFLTFEYIPAPGTILKEVCKLPPGHWLMFQDGRLRIEQYWDVSLQSSHAGAAPGVEYLAELIRDAVRLQLVSDVPLGALLSGGIDSSTVVAMMSEALAGRVHTFTIGFDDASYNEMPQAKEVAAFLNTEHETEILSPRLGALAEHLVGRLDEPLADFSIFPTYLVSRLARRSVKVVLSGDGGDEVFGGYDAYVAQQYDLFYGRLPASWRRGLLPALAACLPPQAVKKGIFNKTRRFVEGGAGPAWLQHARWMMFLSDAERADLYLPALWGGLGEGSPAEFLADHFGRVAHADPLAQQQYVDIKTYLADNILAKVDRMSMAASLEARVPLLDHRIVQFALNLPPQMKVSWGRTKVALRRAMAGRLPRATLSKPKQGFSIPLKNWLRGPLRPLLTDALSDAAIRRRGYFDARTVGRWVKEHLAGRANHSHRLWTLVVFELWQQRVLHAPAPDAPVALPEREMHTVSQAAISGGSRP